jgi:hypothetical protein
MTFGETFAGSSVKSSLLRAGLAWLLITPVVARAKIWGSATAALTVGLVGVGAYVAAAERYMRRHRKPLTE